MTIALKPSPLISLDEALLALLKQAVPLSGVEQVSTFDADGRFLAEDIISAMDVPAFDNSAMDGYALRAAEVNAATGHWVVSQRIAAGQQPEPLSPGAVARIFTGAPMPAGADSVVMQEDCELHQAHEGQLPTVTLRGPVKPGQCVRPRGDDIRQGQVVLRAGTRLGPAHLGLAASLGLSHVAVLRRPRVALFSTGDELVMPGACAPGDLPLGSIFNSNRFFLRALLTRLGVQVQDIGIVPDQREATIEALAMAALDNDVILTSGGVSVGEEDHVKPAVSALGRLDLWQIAIKPGKPFAYGHINRQQQKEGQHPACHFIGLPGNPVSSFVTFLMLVRPFLLALQGAQELAPYPFKAKADFDWPKPDKRREFLRARLNPAGELSLYPNQSSGVLTSLTWADVLIDHPAGATIAKGDWVHFLRMSELLS